MIKSKDWICQCGSIWFNCEKHKFVAERAREIKKQAKIKQEAAKAKMAMIRQEKKEKEASGVSWRRKKKRSRAVEEGNGEDHIGKKQKIHFTKSECQTVMKGGLKRSLLSEGLLKRFSHLM